MSAYSAEMLEACKTVTLKVKVLPIFRWERAFSGDSSSGRSRPRPKLFTGLWGGSGVAAEHKGREAETEIFSFELYSCLTDVFHLVVTE